MSDCLPLSRSRLVVICRLSRGAPDGASFLAAAAVLADGVALADARPAYQLSSAALSNAVRRYRNAHALLVDAYRRCDLARPTEAQFLALSRLMRAVAASSSNRVAHAVLVLGVRQADAVRAHGASRQAASAAVARYREAHRQVCLAFGATS